MPSSHKIARIIPNAGLLVYWMPALHAPPQPQRPDGMLISRAWRAEELNLSGSYGLDVPNGRPSVVQSCKKRRHR